ncbi:MAG: MarR family transcriptional regulator [Phycisphaeraceae bacterium]|nr:MarR family transcriptional regulator [Phycisphaeraceae bacterium]
MQLTEVQQKFVLHWGEMGSRWGINRTVAQIHALLYIAPKPVNADEIAETLSVARSNVSTSLRELQGWGIVQAVPILGERKEHFSTQTDVWEMFMAVLDERKKREIDPTLTLLRECVIEAADAGASEKHTHDRLSDLLGLIEALSGWYGQVRLLPRPLLIRFLKMGSKLKKLIGK